MSMEASILTWKESMTADVGRFIYTYDFYFYFFSICIIIYLPLLPVCIDFIAPSFVKHTAKIDLYLELIYGVTFLENLQKTVKFRH